MKKFFFGAIALTIASLFNLSVRADELIGGEVQAAADCNACQSCCPQSCCDLGACGSWIVDFEATFLRYHRNDDLQTDNIFGFEFAPRVALAYQDANGLGLRLRWWDYDHQGTGTFNGVANAVVDVDTFNLDFEIYQSVQLTECTSVEISGGIRYNDFAESVNAGAVSQDFFSAYGGLFGIKANRSMFGGNVYARWRTAILMDDHNQVTGSGLEFDNVMTQTEIGSGYERTSCLSNGAQLTLRAGVEWSNWTNYVTNNQTGNTNTDIGFGGFVLGAALSY